MRAFIEGHKDINCYCILDWTDDETGVVSTSVYNGSQDWDIFKYREVYEKHFKCQISCREKSIRHHIHTQHNISLNISEFIENYWHTEMPYSSKTRYYYSETIIKV